MKYEDKLRNLALGEGLVQPNLFVKFMMSRFPDEQHDSYILEWVGRFLSGDPTRYMDIESLAKYKELI